jgi:hypothetical protein
MYATIVEFEKWCSLWIRAGQSREVESIKAAVSSLEINPSEVIADGCPWWRRERQRSPHCCNHRKWKYLRYYFQKESKRVVKPKSGVTGQEIHRPSSCQHYNIMLFLKDMLDSEKSQISLDDSSVSEPTKSQDTSFGYHNGENSVTEISYAVSVLSTSRPCSVSSVFSKKTINYSGGSGKTKMVLDSTDP